MVDNRSVDEVLAQIRNQIEQNLNIDPAQPFALLEDATVPAAQA